MFKIVLYVCIVAAGIAAPDTVFDLSGYAWIARVGAFLFLIIMLIILTEVGFDWDEAYTTKAEMAEEGGNSWLVLLLGAR